MTAAEDPGASLPESRSPGTIDTSTSKEMSLLVWLHRGYCLVVLWFTTWVGYIGFFRPKEILRALSWPVPPLHARFIGALYLSASVFLLISLVAKPVRALGTIIVIAFVWTGWLMLVTVIHWSAFDFTRPQAWFWLVAYVAFPVSAGWLACFTPARAGHLADTLTPRPLPGWAAVFFGIQGLLMVILAAWCFVAPGATERIWPWKISSFLAQVYSGPLLAYGVAGLLLALRRDWTQTWIPTIGLLAFASLALIGSSQHLDLFSAGAMSTRLWFAGLTTLAVGCLAVLVAFRASRASLVTGAPRRAR